ncbi:MAG TPA: IPT/TIG domain-containing protein, partial [Parachlamydiaceae bacterium]|nr:IPT/TIG domain-containing protein [Parachlamydiaceae bacterium]
MNFRNFFSLLLSLCFFSNVLAALPVVTNVSPAVAPFLGGTLVVIDGSGFAGTTDVDFGTVPAASFFVVTDSLINAISPLHSP